MIGSIFLEVTFADKLQWIKGSGFWPLWYDTHLGEEYFWLFYLIYGRGKVLKVNVIVSKWKVHLHSRCMCLNFNGSPLSGLLSVLLQMPRIISWPFTIADRSGNLNELYHSGEVGPGLSGPGTVIPPAVDPIKIQSWGLTRRERTKMVKISAANSGRDDEGRGG